MASSGLVIWVVIRILKGLFGCVLPRAAVEWQQYCLHGLAVGKKKNSWLPGQANDVNNVFFSFPRPWW
jgi:hypothetical protein